MEIKLIQKDARIEGATIILDDVVNCPIYLGCMFSHCKFLIGEKSMMKAFSQCIFDTCVFKYKA